MGFFIGEKVLVKTPFTNGFIFGIIQMHDNKLYVVGLDGDFVYEQSLWNNGTVEVKKIGA